MKKFGFTLAEVLVSVAIVGVIAALTLPTLRTNTTDAQIGPKLAKAVSTFEQANESLLNSFSSDSLSDAGLTSSTEMYINNLSTFLKLTPTEDDCFKTKDNMEFTVSMTNTPANTNAPAYMQRLGDITININPQNNRAIDGTNVFYFSFWNDGSLRPKGGTNWEGGAYDCEKDESGVCKKDGDGKEILEANARDIRGGNSHWQTKCAANTFPSDGKFCAGHIFENNLKVLYN